jgi:hypothetical protein
MALISRGQLVSDIREFMDSVGSQRWSDPLIKAVANSVHDSEWSEILNAAPTYTFATRQVQSTSDGQVPFTALNGGAADSQQNWYRILSLTNGNVVYSETRFQDVPLGTTANVQNTYDKMYYVAGNQVQVLPAVAETLTISVNYKPTALLDLSSDNATVEYPENSHFILVWLTAAQLLLKGGAESGAAAQLRALAESERVGMLNDIRRRTINPTRLAYSDSKYDWAGG